MDAGAPVLRAEAPWPQKELSTLKLEFSTEALTCYRPVLRESKTLEETAEAILPEDCPEVAEVLYTGGQCCLRGREVQEGSATVSAGVSASAVLCPAGRETPEVVEVYIPISARFESPALKPGQRSRVQVCLRRLDSHMVSPGRVMIRAAVSVSLWVWERREEKHPQASTEPDLQVLRRTEPLKLLTAMGEKSYTLEDTVTPEPPLPGSRLADAQVSLTHTESRLTGTRAVLKGTALIRSVWVTEAGQLSACRAELPFSQYIDLEDCQETDELRLDTALTGMELEPAGDGAMGVTLQLLSTAEVWSARELRYIADVYGVRGQAVPQVSQCRYESLLDRQFLSAVGRGTIPGGGDPTVAVTCLPGEATHTRSGETVSFTLPVQVRAMWMEEGVPASGSVRVELTCATQAAADCRFEVEPEQLTAATSPGIDGLDVKVSGTLAVRTYAATEVREITEVELVEAEETGDRPGLIIRRLSSRESLWDVAKQYRTTMAAIEGANGLSGAPAVGTLLLIPGR